MKTYQITILAIIACASIGCAHLPAGYAQSNADNVAKIATAACEAVYGPGAATIAPASDLASCGRAGAAQYRAVIKDVPKQEAMRGGVRAMLVCAKSLTPPLDYAGMAEAMRTVCGQIGSDADQLFGLLLAGLRQPPPK